MPSKAKKRAAEKPKAAPKDRRAGDRAAAGRAPGRVGG